MRLRESALALASRCTAEVLSGRYRLDARIGSGGAADVHRGYDLRLRRAVAVKVFRSGAGGESDKGFESEAVILARLQHPGLVTAYDAGRHDGRAYLVMQLIDGSTLKARIAEGALPCRDTAALGADLARALAHAHEAGIVHRDVKPSNILLDAAGRPHLTDFGISRMVDATTRTATGVLVGTAAYLSPEQVLGHPVGRPADVYALGLVLLECLTGRLEYDGGPLEAAIARLHRAPVLPGGLPGELAALLRDMTALDELTRPTALDCARTLAAFADSPRPEPAGPTAATTAMRARTPAARAAGPGRTPSAGAPALLSAPAPSRKSVRGDEATHRGGTPATERPAPATVGARRRVLAGGTVALATVMAAALAVTDGFSEQGGHGITARAAGRPAGHGDPQSGSSGGDSASPTPGRPPASAGGASHQPSREAASARGSSAAFAGARPDPAGPTGGPADRAQAGRTAAAPGPRSGKAAKPGKEREAKAAPKPAGKKQRTPGTTD
ncbi:serine/threonine-protein kinase [Streptomyces hilarionis]|uniref:serine/threonine-protein kinase n=1 Tax=Streptomyces hilarionis TaxID=2839954 RepID=UPI00211A38D4|nr:serine/threonine-protein kinase [Streptomyces hilarionis]MCQ9130875.1 protein kinase [Streptomyces hilarionis]